MFSFLLFLAQRYAETSDFFGVDQQSPDERSFPPQERWRTGSQALDSPLFSIKPSET
jgi:hypothetical protein